MQDFKFPYALDKSTNKSSATLFFAYISFWQTFVLILIFANADLAYALVASFVLFIITIFIYRARRIDSLKVGKEGFEIGDDGKDNEDEVDVPTKSKKVPINESEKVEGWGNASAKSD